MQRHPLSPDVRRRSSLAMFGVVEMGLPGPASLSWHSSYAGQASPREFLVGCAMRSPKGEAWWAHKGSNLGPLPCEGMSLANKIKMLHSFSSFSAVFPHLKVSADIEPPSCPICYQCVVPEGSWGGLYEAARVQHASRRHSGGVAAQGG